MASNVIILGISGKMGSGKSTIANYITRWLQNKGYNVWHTSFGECLKKCATTIYRIPLEDLNSQDGKCTKYPLEHIPQRALIPGHGALFREQLINPEWVAAGEFTARQALQFFGTEVMRKRCEGHWVEQLNLRIKHRLLSTNTDIIIVDDVRFLNELIYVQDNGFCVRLDGRQLMNSHTIKEGHSSETALDAACFDALIVNEPFQIHATAMKVLKTIERYY